jgi:hypothetical protein
VTPPKVVALALGFSAVTPSLAVTNVSGETTLATVVITTHGGPVELIPTIGTQGVALGNSSGTFLWTWYRDATPIGGLLVSLANLNPSLVAMPITGPTVFDPSPTAGAHTYHLTVQTSNVGIVIVTPASFGGGIYAKELLA